MRHPFLAPAIAAAVLLSVSVGGCSVLRSPTPAVSTPTVLPSEPSRTRITPAGQVVVGDLSVVARARGATVPVYATQSAQKPTRVLRSPLPSGTDLVFLVLREGQERAQVLLPVRPNGSRGWVRLQDVQLLEHEYRIAVSVGKRRLALYHQGRRTMLVPVGLGSRTTPTPGGVYYTKELYELPDRNGAYGPYAYGLSGYSEVLDEFLGGEGEIGIHGTNAPDSVGRSVSHGCIRMRNKDIRALVPQLPLGVPVEMIG